MKKFYLTLAMLSPFFGFSQVTYPESSANVFDKKHEIRLSTINLISGNSLEIGYEYLAHRNYSYGAYGHIHLGSAEQNSFGITPYFRFYFNSSQEYGAKGFFAEPMLALQKMGYSEGIYDSTNSTYIYNEKSNFNIAPGIALGWKWVNTSGFVIDIRSGVVRNLIIPNANPDGYVNFQEFMPRADVSIGYRF